MPLELNREVFVTSAVTGSGAMQDRSAYVLRGLAKIAQAAIETGAAGGAITGFGALCRVD